MDNTEDEIERIRGLAKWGPLNRGMVFWGSRFHRLDGDWKRLVDDLESQAALESIRRQIGDDEAIQFIEDARYIAWEIYSSLNRSGAELRSGDEIEPLPAGALEQDHKMWQHHLSSVWTHRYLALDTIGFKISDKAPHLRAEAISNAIGAYLARPYFRVKYAEHWLLDALVYCQTVEFLRGNSKLLQDRSISLSRACVSILFFGVLPFAAIYGLYQAHDTTAEFWAFAYYVIVACPILFWEGSRGLVRPRWKELTASSAVFGAMQEAYRLLGDDCASVSPRRLWEVLDSAEKIGASWNAAVWPMLERATTNADGWNIKTSISLFPSSNALLARPPLKSDA